MLFINIIHYVHNEEDRWVPYLAIWFCAVGTYTTLPLKGAFALWIVRIQENHIEN